MNTRPTRLPNGKRDPTYIVWFTMKERCLLRTHNMYPKYGGAGITVCDRWLSFENFLTDMGERPTGKTLTPERFREVEPLALPDWTAHAAQVVKGIFQIGDIYWTVPEARALRDWLTKALPEDKP